jgi:hypothetical protein
MERYDWKRLTTLQVGRYAEYFVKMEFTLYGFAVYQAEVDDKGIDFVIRKDNDRYHDIHVKSVQGLNYIFFRKEYFELRENLYAAIVIFDSGESPKLFLVPATLWLNPNALFVSRDYGHQKRVSLNGEFVCPRRIILCFKHMRLKTQFLLCESH